MSVAAALAFKPAVEDWMGLDAAPASPSKMMDSPKFALSVARFSTFCLQCPSEELATFAVGIH